MNPVHIAEVTSAPDKGLKFVYPSGSRPLEGYTIKRGIGRGGFGEVYFATSDGGKEVALKLIRRNLDIELRGVQHCLNLKHPNLIALYDIRQDDQGDSWVVMEYVDGAALEEVLARNSGGLPQAEALKWFDGLCAAVAYLHDHGIVHRDLKPGNVFFDGAAIDDGMVKLGDYGLSKFISVSRRSGQTESVGTVHYMAPEIANGRYGKEIDIYALGIMLYELLTGHVPFEGESVGEVLMKHLTSRPDLSRVGEPFRSAIAACLAKDPQDRPQSVAELRAMLGDELKEHGLNAHGASETFGTATNQPLRRVTSRFSLQGEWGRRWHKYWNSLSERQQIAHRFGLMGAVVVLALVVSPTFRALGYQAIVGQFTNLSGMRWLPIMLGPLVGLALFFALRTFMLKRSSTGAGARHARPTEFYEQDGSLLDIVPLDSPVTVDSPPRRVVLSAESTVRAVRRQQWIDWSGSLLQSFAIAAGVSLMLLLLRGQPPEPELFAWLMLSTVVGSWLLLSLTAYWASQPEEPAMRRYVTALAGLLCGAAAWGLDQALLVDLPYDLRVSAASGHAFFDTLGQPKLYAYLAYFGVLFLTVRWWRQADLRRTARFSVFGMIAAATAAWLVTYLAMFPQPWGSLFAVALSITVQLSAPWQVRRAAPPVVNQWVVM